MPTHRPFRPLKLALAALVAALALLALAAGFVVVAVLGAVALLFLLVRRIITGRPVATVKFQVRRQGRASVSPRKFNGADAIDVEAKPAEAPPKSLEN